MNWIVISVVCIVVFFLFYIPIEQKINEFKTYWFHKRKMGDKQLEMRSQLSECVSTWDVFCWLQNAMQDEPFTVDFLREVVNMLDEKGRKQLEERICNCIKYGHYLTQFFAINCNIYIRDGMVKYLGYQLEQLNAKNFFKRDVI